MHIPCSNMLTKSNFTANGKELQKSKISGKKQKDIQTQDMLSPMIHNTCIFYYNSVREMAASVQV